MFPSNTHDVSHAHPQLSTAPPAVPHVPRGLVRLMPWLANPALWWFGMGLWLVAVFTLSSISGPDLPEGPEVPHLDKLVHAMLYASGAYAQATAMALTRRKQSPRAHTLSLYIVAALTLMLIGALDELYQLRTPGRTGADVYDWLADAAGACLVCGVLAVLAHLGHGVDGGRQRFRRNRRNNR